VQPSEQKPGCYIEWRKENEKLLLHRLLNLKKFLQLRKENKKIKPSYNVVPIINGRVIDQIKFENNYSFIQANAFHQLYFVEFTGRK